MKVLAFGATNSTTSINQQLAGYAASLIEGSDIEIIDLNDFEMPIYSQQRESDAGIPDLAQQFFKKIGGADAIIISFAEHNGSYTAAYKNLFDWTSRIDMKVYQNKAMLLLATSPGPGGANSVLSAAINSAPFFAADVKGSLSIPNFFDNFDMEKQELSNKALAQALEGEVAKLTREV